jgi:hypothetical protein
MPQPLADALVVLLLACPGREPPFLAVMKTAIENRFTVENAKTA